MHVLKNNYTENFGKFLEFFMLITRSCCPGAFSEKDILRNLAKFTRKHLCLSLFFNKVAGLRLATLLKKRLAQVFFVNFAKFLKTPFLTEPFRWLFLY